MTDGFSSEESARAMAVEATLSDVEGVRAPPPSRGFGRPSLYDPRYCDLVYSMGARGCEVVEMAHVIGVHRDTLYEWAKVHPDFSDALALAREAAEALITRQARRSALDGEAQSANALMAYARSRFQDSWGDKRTHELTGPGGQPLQMGASVVVLIDGADDEA